MKLLFISERLLWKKTGAEKVSKNLLCSCIDVLGEDNVDIVSFSKIECKSIDSINNLTIYNINYSIIQKLVNRLKLNIGGLNNRNINKILRKIDLNNYDYIFLDSSSYGKIAQKIKIKYPNIKIVVFFHDVGKFWIKSLLKSTNDIIKKMKLCIDYPAYVYNEMLITQNADIFIALNERDSNLLNKEYGISVETNIPVTIKDRFNLKRINKKENKEVSLLFVGAYYLPNVKGIKWFIDKVLPYIDNAKLVVIGNGIEIIKDDIENSNVQVLGFVEDLDEYYYNADCIVAPIFDGGGMKVKVAEAMMYGKMIFGTRESLEGYEFKAGVIGEECNTDKEFIEQINCYIKNNRLNKFNEECRNIFVNKYEYNSSVKKISKILKGS